MRHNRASAVLAVAAVAALAVPGLGAPRPSPRPPTITAVAGLGSDPSVVGLVLSGQGATLYPPLSPTDKAYGPDCQSLVDPGFTGKCAVATSAQGTVAGVVEQETAALEGGGPRTGPARSKVVEVQERDLVWRRKGRSWALVLRRVFNTATVPTRLWSGDVEARGRPDLVFVTPSDEAGFGNELDVVDGAGQVSLYRFLGEGFVVAPGPGELVAYVPGWREQRPVQGAYDQTLIGYSAGIGYSTGIGYSAGRPSTGRANSTGSWRVVSQQFVPDAAALAQHQGPFRDAAAVPAS